MCHCYERESCVGAVNDCRCVFSAKESAEYQERPMAAPVTEISFYDSGLYLHLAFKAILSGTGTEAYTLRQLLQV